MIKSSKRELPGARIGVITQRGRSIDAALQRLKQERRQVHSLEQEVVCDGDKRLVRRLRNVKERPRETANPPVQLDSSSVVIATGGARGVTAIMVDALLKDYGCTVIAVGRSPLEKGPEHFDHPSVEQEYYARFVRENPGRSPIEMRKSFQAALARWEAHQTIEDMQHGRGRIEYRTLNVTNPDDVASFVSEVADEFGRCLLYTSPSPRDATLSRMPSSA